MLGTSKAKRDDKSFDIFITTTPVSDLSENLLVFGRVVKGEDVVQVPLLFFNLAFNSNKMSMPIEANLMMMIIIIAKFFLFFQALATDWSVSRGCAVFLISYICWSTLLSECPLTFVSPG